MLLYGYSIWLEKSQFQFYFLLSTYVWIVLPYSYNIQVIGSRKSPLVQKMNVKHLWTQEEDLYLRKSVPGKGKTDWTKIMEDLNTKFPGRDRSAKQCRQRYVNYSKFSEGNLESLRWKPEQFESLFNEFTKWGPRWNIIARSLPQKSGNSIKNKFYGGLRKTIRRMNNIEKQEKGKIKKRLKYESVVRIIEAPECLSNLEPSLKEQSLELRGRIIELVRNCQETFDEKDISDLVNQINQFNLATRSYRTKRKKMPESWEDNADNSQQVSPTTKCTKNQQEPKSRREVGERRVKQEMVKQEAIEMEEAEQSNVAASIAPALTMKEIQIGYQAQPKVGAEEVLNILGEQSSPLEQQDLY